MLSYVMKGPRGRKSERFWRLVKRSQNHTPRAEKIKTSDGVEIEHSQIVTHLDNLATQILGAEESAETEFINRIEYDTGIQIHPVEIKKAIACMNKHTAMGTDLVPASIFKDMSWTGIEYLTKIFNNLLNGSEVFPQDWREGRVTMYPKKDSSKGVLNTYRPITVSPVLYRIFGKVVARKLLNWLKDNKKLGEMQNGFRPNRRGD